MKVGDDGIATAPLIVPGFYQLMIQAGSAKLMADVLVFPREVLDIPAVRYSDRSKISERPNHERRAILRSLAVHSTREGARSVLGDSPGAPHYGADVPMLCGSGRLADHGATV